MRKYKITRLGPLLAGTIQQIEEEIELKSDYVDIKIERGFIIFKDPDHLYMYPSNLLVKIERVV